MRELAVWICPDCGFTFDACHSDEKDGGYSCPACAEIRLEKQIEALEREKEEADKLHMDTASMVASLMVENDAMREALEWYGDDENYRRSEKDYQTGYPHEIMWDKGKKARDVIASLQGTESKEGDV